MNINKFNRFSVVFVLLISLFATSAVYAQASGDTGVNAVAVTSDGTSGDDITAKDITRWTLLGGTLPVVFAFGIKSWDWGNRHTPYSRGEGYFGNDTSFGGADKVGHMLAHYVIQRGMYSVFDWTENGGSQKWLYSIGLTMGTGLFIEFGDAYTSQYGFSKEDLIMDYTGILCAALLDYSPMLDGFIGFSMQYVPSDGYRVGYKQEGMLKYCLDIVNDYSGNQYMMNFKVAGFQNLGFDVPLPLRLLSIDLGYYTLGYTHYDVGKYAKKHERDIFIGVSINTSQLLAEIWPEEHRGLGYKIPHTFFQYYHVPYDRVIPYTRYVSDLNE